VESEDIRKKKQRIRKKPKPKKNPKEKDEPTEKGMQARLGRSAFYRDYIFLASTILSCSPSNSRLRTSSNPSLPFAAFWTKRWREATSSLSAMDFHRFPRAEISAVWEKRVCCEVDVEIGEGV
jgi:hypothetical protein